MNPNQRSKASVDLTNTYLGSYYAEWRLAKVLTNEKLLKIRYEFYDDIVARVKPKDDLDGMSTIAQEIRNGLYFDTIAQTVQYIEDLFALIKASGKPDYFIRNVVTYSAGEVISLIKAFKVDRKSVAKAFHFPDELETVNEESLEIFEKDLTCFCSLLKDIQLFYKNYEFFYNQYKHGLAVALRPYGNLYNTEQITADKNGKFKPYLVVWDNMNFHAASKRGNFNVATGVMMPCFTENIRPFISQLQNENNLLRFVYPPDIPDMSIDLLVDKALKIRACINVFIHNYQSSINSDNGNPRKFAFPFDYKDNTYNTYTVNV